MKKSRSIWSSIGIGLLTAFVIVFFAYGFQVTKVDLEETKSEVRRTQFSRIIRALGNPDLFEYDFIEVNRETSFMIPCPEGDYSPKYEGHEDGYILPSKPCGEPKEKVLIEGFNFAPQSETRLYFVTAGGVDLSLTIIDTDNNGNFSVEVVLPDRPSSETQSIRADVKQNIGTPHLSKNAKDTWEKIIETVFLALLATTFGIFAAIPLSLFAARNLMEDITNTVMGISLNILLVPVGIIIGMQGTKWIKFLVNLIPSSTLFTVGSFVICSFFSYFFLKWFFSKKEEASPETKITKRIMGFISYALISALLVANVYLLTKVFKEIENIFIAKMNRILFLGTFLGDIGEIVDMVLSIILAIAVATVFLNSTNKLSKYLLSNVKIQINKFIQIILTAAAGFVLFAIFGAVAEWLYQFGNPLITRWIPGGIGAGIGFALSIIVKPKQQLPIGITIFYLARGIFNILRSIDAVIMVVVFVVWVGIGPFAGVLALSLHTIAALSKLYSEQIESILPGPIEAVKATGANRLQTIIYAVVPQIIPPYISFTLYRWDINVRMSTIIGLGGGGGIGFLLMQNINLINYRKASAQMIAIAVVVSIMDQLSSKLREKLI